MRTRLMFDNTVAACVCITFFVACSVYDDKLMENIGGGKNTSSEGITHQGGGGKNTGAVDTGSGVASGGSSGDTGGGSAQGGSAGSSTRTVTSDGCGDGRVNGTEKCDVAIEQGKVGACPLACPAEESCTKWQLDGSECTAVCVSYSRDCKSGDGCCPSDCSHVTDSDCSSKCGDGVIEAGETCEPAKSSSGKEFPDASKVCPTKCPDDGNPCTKEQLSGSPANCNAVCERVPITSIVNGDGCCPEGANASADSDCPANCGNGIREANEECDGTEGCDSQCKSTLTADQQNCFANYHYADASDACNRCMCVNCLTTFTLCYGSSDEALNADCAKLVSCGFANNCTGSICYCGTAAINPADPYGLCVGVPNGPCKGVIEEVVGTPDIAAIFYTQMYLTNANGRARAVGDCYSQRCADVCRK